MIVTGFDCETTGLEWADGHRMIEVCCHIWDTTTMTRRGGFSRRINPERSIQAAAQAIHGITPADVAACPLFKTFAPLIQRVSAATDLWVAHNGIGFDMPFLEAELKREGMILPAKPCFDTMLEGRWATPMGKVPSLEELCFACGVNYDPAAAHAADYDVSVMMESFFRGLEWGFFRLPELAPVIGVAA